MGLLYRIQLKNSQKGEVGGAKCGEGGAFSRHTTLRHLDGFAQKLSKPSCLGFLWEFCYVAMIESLAVGD